MKGLVESHFPRRPIAPTLIRAMSGHLNEMIQANQFGRGIKVFPYDGGVILEADTNVTRDEVNVALDKIDNVARKYKLSVVLNNEQDRCYVVFGSLG